MIKNLYVVLGVSPAASQEDIKRAYRKKAVELHPDQHGPDAGPFMEVQDAYAVLSDPSKRQMHDARIEAEWGTRARRPVRAEPIAARRPPAEPLIPQRRPPVEDVSLVRSFQTFSPSFDEIFDRLLNNFTAAARHAKSEHVESLTIDVPVSRERAFHGGQVRILVPAVIQCPTCDGRGGVGPFECWRCRSRGEVSGEFPVSFTLPPGIPDGYEAGISLDHLGIRNLYLVVRFIVR